jgi:hypothetical protein
MTSPLDAPFLTPLIDYTASKREVYLHVMILLLKISLSRSLLLVESPHRPITSNGLPSWVPDWMTDQSLCARSIFLASTVPGASVTGNNSSDESGQRGPLHVPWTILAF